MLERMMFLNDSRVPEYERDLFFLKQQGWNTRAEIKLEDKDQVLLYLEREVHSSTNRQNPTGRRKSDIGPRHRL